MSKEEGADFITFPEMSLTGFTMNVKEMGEKEPNLESVLFFQRLAKKYKIAIGFGRISLEGEKAYNKYMIINKEGQILVDYAKIHPFSYGGETNYYAKGDQIMHCELDGIKITPFICYDLRFPEIFQIASKKAHLILVAANWPEIRREDYTILLRARAIENQCYIAGVNRIGQGNYINYVGDSEIYDPFARKVSTWIPMKSLEKKNGELDCAQEGLYIAHIDKNKIEQLQSKFPVKQDRREELYKNIPCLG